MTSEFFKWSFISQEILVNVNRDVARIPLSTGFDVTSAQKLELEQCQSFGEKIHHLHFLPPLFLFRFLFQPLYLSHLQFSNKWRLSHEMYELSQYKIALDKGIIPPSITTLTTTDPAQWCSPSEWTMSFRKLFFNYYNKWFFK